MILAGHADAAHINLIKACSRAGTHIMLSEDVLIPLHNGLVFAIAKIIKNVMPFDSEAELAGLFNISKEMFPLRQELIKMRLP